MNDSMQKVLVVDDEPINLELLTEYLRLAGFASEKVGGGKDAWDLLQAYPERYSAVLLDRLMPGMDGMEVLSLIKSDKTLSTLPVIMQSCMQDNQSILEGLQAGAYYYLTKPYDRQTLSAVVNTAVDDYQRYQALQKNTRKTSNALKMMVKGQFTFRTLNDARDLAALLANACFDSDRVVLGLTELMINAVEHGNLGIGYNEKSNLNSTGMWENEVLKRLDQSEYKNKQATVSFERNSTEIVFHIYDQGEGFDWMPYLGISLERAMDTHGRGIALANSISFDTIEYRGNGNEVCAIVLN